MKDLIIGCAVRPKIPLRNQRVIIFDSPDGTGKTNISQALSRELAAQGKPTPYFRMGSQHDNWRKGKFREALEFDQTYISEFLRQTKSNVIIDRAYPSEWVYSQVYARDTNTKVLMEVDRAFAQMGTYIVIPLRRDYTKSRDDEVVDQLILPHLHDVYLEFMKWTKCDCIAIYVDDFDNDVERQLPLLMNELKWGGQLGGTLGNMTTNVTISRYEEKKESDIFKQAALAISEKELKFGDY